MKFFKALSFVILLLLLSSCIQAQQLEDLGIILSRGVDKLDDEQIEINMAVLQFQKDSPSYTKTVSGRGKAIKSAVRQANRKANQRLVPGKLELEIYDQELAKDGLNPYLDTLQRDPDIPTTLLLAVSEVKTKEIFNVEDETINTNLGDFLHGLIQPSVERRLFPGVTVHRFGVAIRNPGIDPVLPIMGIEEGIPTLTGIAVFKEDKMVERLPLENSQMFSIMEGTLRGEFLEISVPTNEIATYLLSKERIEKEKNVNIVFIIEKGTGDIKLTDKENLQFDTNINLQLNLQEISINYKLDDVKAIRLLEKAIEQQIKQQFEKILTKLKEVKADAFGFGTQYRIKNKGGKLEKEEWDKLFPDIKVNVNVQIEIIRHGEIHR